MINYTLTATNDGNVTLTGVTVVDTKASPLVCTIDTVPGNFAVRFGGRQGRGLHRQLPLHADRHRRRQGR